MDKYYKIKGQLSISVATIMAAIITGIFTVIAALISNNPTDILDSSVEKKKPIHNTTNTQIIKDQKNPEEQQQQQPQTDFICIGKFSDSLDCKL